jgi:putative ABC transport system permease protein
MLQDLKSAGVALLKNRWFTCVTVLTLALGIGANTAIFGVVNKLLLSPLPYADSDRLLYLRLETERGQFGISASAYMVGAWREQARSFDGIEGYTSRDVLAYDENGARVLRGMQITPGLPSFLGVAPLLGRGFTAADVAAGAPAVVMLSHEMWQRDYGGTPDVVGRALLLDDVSHVVVGVLPGRWDAFARDAHPEVWFPQALPASVSPRTFQLLEALGRVRPGVSVDAAASELDAIYSRVQAEAGNARPAVGNDPLSVRVERPSDRVDANARDALLVLLGAVGLVLLVACSNVANLLLARGASRARELSLRSALGASTWRLVRALFAECVMLALAAGVVGVAIGWATLRILVQLRPSSLSSLGEVQLDPAVLAFTFGVSVATALLFGVAPALQLTSRKLGGALRHGASGVVRGGAGPRLRKLLVTAQMMVSVVLLVGAGLLIRSVIHLQSIDVGFDTENLFSARLAMPRARYTTPASRDLLAEQLLDRIRSSPGVSAATQAFLPPPEVMTAVGSNLEIRGVTLSAADAQAASAENFVRPDYFSTLGIRLLEGRTFTADEARGDAAVIVNRAAAQRYWPAGGALGAEIRSGQTWAKVVGVVDNVVLGSLTRSQDTPQLYSALQADRGPLAIPGMPLVLIVRATEDPAAAIASVRDAVRVLDPEIAITNLLRTETALANTIDAPRFNMALLIAFAVIGLVLAAVGLAAVIGYEVTERTHEIGIRMALGARAENVRRLAMRQGLTPALIGVVVGIVGALAATQLATGLLYGVAPRDPATFVGVVALLVLVALGASWVPARRATRVDPITALRAD